MKIEDGFDGAQGCHDLSSAFEKSSFKNKTLLILYSHYLTISAVSVATSVPATPARPCSFTVYNQAALIKPGKRSLEAGCRPQYIRKFVFITRLHS